MTKWASLFAAAALTASPSSAALVYYEFTLTTDAPYTGFGGGSAGDVFAGSFGFDDSLLTSPGAVFEPILSENAFFVNIDLNGSTFSTSTPGADFDRSALKFSQGELLDIYFEIITPGDDRLEVATDFAKPETFWLATEGAGGGSSGGASLGDSISFRIIPEPSSLTLGALAILGLLRRRR